MAGGHEIYSDQSPDSLCSTHDLHSSTTSATQRSDSDASPSSAEDRSEHRETEDPEPGLSTIGRPTNVGTASRLPRPRTAHQGWQASNVSTAKCDMCHKQRCGTIQKCAQCKLSICRGCALTDRLRDDERHALDPAAVSWDLLHPEIVTTTKAMVARGSRRPRAETDPTTRAQTAGKAMNGRSGSLRLGGRWNPYTYASPQHATPQTAPTDDGSSHVTSSPRPYDLTPYQYVPYGKQRWSPEGGGDQGDTSGGHPEHSNGRATVSATETCNAAEILASMSGHEGVTQNSQHTQLRHHERQVSLTCLPPIRQAIQQTERTRQSEHLFPSLPSEYPALPSLSGIMGAMPEALTCAGTPTQRSPMTLDAHVHTPRWESTSVLWSNRRPPRSTRTLTMECWNPLQRREILAPRGCGYAYLPRGAELPPDHAFAPIHERLPEHCSLPCPEAHEPLMAHRPPHPCDGQPDARMPILMPPFHQAPLLRHGLESTRQTADFDEGAADEHHRTLVSSAAFWKDPTTSRSRFQLFAQHHRDNRSRHRSRCIAPDIFNRGNVLCTAAQDIKAQEHLDWSLDRCLCLAMRRMWESDIDRDPDIDRSCLLASFHDAVLFAALTLQLSSGHSVAIDWLNEQGALLHEETAAADHKNEHPVSS